MALSRRKGTRGGSIMAPGSPALVSVTGEEETVGSRQCPIKIE
jgi:hypothetical protein